MDNQPKKACSIHLDRGIYEEMDIDYSIIEEKVKELNLLGIDISLQEVGEIIESKFSGKLIMPDLRRWDDGRLLYPQYTLLRTKNKI